MTVHRRVQARATVWAVSFAMLIVALSGGVRAGERRQTDSAEMVSGMLAVTIEVELSCPSCAQGLERRLGRLPNVLSVDIRGDEGRVTVTPLRGTSVDVAVVRDVIRNAGFVPSRIAVTVRGRVRQQGESVTIVMDDGSAMMLAGGARTDRLVAEAAGALARVEGDVTSSSGESSSALVVNAFSVLP